MRLGVPGSIKLQFFSKRLEHSKTQISEPQTLSDNQITSVTITRATGNEVATAKTKQRPTLY
jgi:hypothetical protein